MSALPRDGRSWPELAQTLRDLKRDDLDWRGGRHAAFVWHADEAVEQVAREAYALFMTENGLGLRVFPSLRRMESDVVAMVAGVLGGDDAVRGAMTSGGTESIFLGAHAARQWARQHRPDVTAPEIVAAFSAHPAIDKAAHYLGMRVVRVPTGSDFRADVAAMAAAVTPRTVMLLRLGAHLLPGPRGSHRRAWRAARRRAGSGSTWTRAWAASSGPSCATLGHPVPAFGLDAAGGDVAVGRSPQVGLRGQGRLGGPLPRLRRARPAGAGSSATGRPGSTPCPRSRARDPAAPSPRRGR